MPFNGSGTFVRVHDWTTDEGNAIDIEADRMDEEFDGIATALTACIKKNGESAFTANQSLGGFKLLSVGNATLSTDAPNTAQVQKYALNWCSTAGGTVNAQTLTPSPAITAYTAGQGFSFIPVGTNTGAVTLAVSGLTTKELRKNIGNAMVAVVAGDILAATIAEVRYDGTYFELLNPPVYSHGADVASATTTVLDTTTGDVIDVTGTTTITAITLAEGRERTVRFTGALTLTHGASLVLPSSADILTVAGDYAVFRGYASGVVRCVSYNRLAGTNVGGALHKVGSTTRDISTASGTQAITGIGFKPKSIQFSACVGATVQASWGQSDGTTHKCISSNYNGSAGQFAANDAAVFIYVDGSNTYSGAVSSLDADGFTFTWTKTGSPTGTASINYIAQR